MRITLYIHKQDAIDNGLYSLMTALAEKNIARIAEVRDKVHLSFELKPFKRKKTPEEKLAEKSKKEAANLVKLKEINSQPVYTVPLKTGELVELAEEKAIGRVIESFEYVNPDVEVMYSKKFIRESARFLLRNCETRYLFKLIDTLSITNTIPYFPIITTPAQLKSKMSTLVSKMLQEIRRTNKSLAVDVPRIYGETDEEYEERSKRENEFDLFETFRQTMS